MEKGWRGAAPVLCLLGCSAMGALFPVTMTPPGDARAQRVPAMPLEILIITQQYTHC